MKLEKTEKENENNVEQLIKSLFLFVYLLFSFYLLFSNSDDGP